MLLVVTARKEGEKFAHNHIADSGCVQMFCGDYIPSPVLDCGLDDPRNPYVGKGTVTCSSCLSEFNNGRREGFKS